MAKKSQAAQQRRKQQRGQSRNARDRERLRLRTAEERRRQARLAVLNPVAGGRALQSALPEQRRGSTRLRGRNGMSTVDTWTFSTRARSDYARVSPSGFGACRTPIC